jgi:hypothetical protein
VTSKWIYKIKHATNDSTEKYKARFVARGFSQKEGEDYDEMFSPVAKYTSIRSIIAIASAMGWKLHQMDVECYPRFLGITRRSCLKAHRS